MQSYIVKRPRNAAKPVGVRWRDGKSWRQRSFASMAEAERFRHELALGIAQTAAVSAQTFGDAARAWIATRRAPRTRESYTGVLTNHLAAFAKRPIADVAMDRDGVIAACHDHPRGHHMLVVLRNVCQEAVQADKITKHCLDGIPLARREDAHDAARFCPVTRDQLETMADRLGAHGLTVWLMYGAGLRVSEALAMTAGDVCGSYIRVRRQIDRAGKLVPLKGRSAGDYRDVPCPGWLAEKITAHLDAYPAGSDGRMFTMVYRDYWTKFRLAAVRAGLPDEYSPHWLRHLFASVMLAAGVPITDLAKWLGHRDPKVTFDTYGHLMPDNMERARQASDAAWQAA